jgi:hypothetical protein
VPQQLMKLCIKSSTCQHQLLPRLNAHGRIQQDLETARTELRAVRKDLKDTQKKEAHAVREALLSEEAERDVSLAMCACRIAGLLPCHWQGNGGDHAPVHDAAHRSQQGSMHCIKHSPNGRLISSV